MKQSEALDTITKIRLAHQAMESACKRIDELKEENKNLKEALAKQSGSVERGNVSEKLGEPNWKVIAEERAIEISKMTSNKYPFVHIRMDVSEAEKEGALKDKLIELGWTPPNSEKQEEDYLSKAYRLANELRCHLAIAPAPQQRDSSATPRTWVGLTDEEIMNIAKVSCIGISPHEDTLNFAKVIEAAHGIKE